MQQIGMPRNRLMVLNLRFELSILKSTSGHNESDSLKLGNP